MLSKIKAESQAPKKTLKLSTLVSSLLQVYPSPIFNCGIRAEPGFQSFDRRKQQEKGTASTAPGIQISNL
jgi:hypothetical protein